ncbi:MAG: hypothetical protein ACPIOQ_59305, partial [Promethearchaeia archaeon]
MLPDADVSGSWSTAAGAHTNHKSGESTSAATFIVPPSTVTTESSEHDKGWRRYASWTGAFPLS